MDPNEEDVKSAKQREGSKPPSRSYAGRQEIGPFHKSFSSIAGPNGSGKFNIPSMPSSSSLVSATTRCAKRRCPSSSTAGQNILPCSNAAPRSISVRSLILMDLEAVPGSQLVAMRTTFKDNTSKRERGHGWWRQSRVGRDEPPVQGGCYGAECIEELRATRRLNLSLEVEKLKMEIEKCIADAEIAWESELELLKIAWRRRGQPNFSLKAEWKKEAGVYAVEEELEEYFRFVGREKTLSSIALVFALHVYKGGENEDGLDIVGTASLKQPIDQALAAVEEVWEMRAGLLRGVAAQTALREEERHKENMAHIEEVKANYKIRQNYADVRDVAAKINQRHTEHHEATLGVRSRAVLDKRPKTQVFHDQITVKQPELAPRKAGIDGKRSEIEVATSQRDGSVRGMQLYLALELEAARAHAAVSVSTQPNLAQRRASVGSTRQTVTQARASQAEGKNPNAALQASTNLASEGKVQGFRISFALVVLACIEHLRRTKVRATAQQITKKPQPEDVPRLFDLKEPKFGCAFHKAVGRRLSQRIWTLIVYRGPITIGYITVQMIEANGVAEAKLRRKG
ncbi:hypothetical protein BDZ89DRAFT_1048191 [Hymenopellis radicata]|nr:hypothetical protein BDZ89DRAFT_1048191 [Hymenopellis radicata]